LLSRESALSLPKWRRALDPAEIRTSLELFSEGGKLLLNLGKFPAQSSDFFFQLGEAIGSGRKGMR